MQRSWLLGACAVIALTGALERPAYAQGATDPQAQPEAGLPGDIIVTARRRVETVQETPVAMTVLNEQLLDRYSVDGVADIASLTPGLYTGESSGAMGGSISLRGVGSGESMAFIDQAVSVNVDGVPISSAQILRAAQMDLKQIEVLRGPQALFFGKNSPGGIISVLTADPGDELEAMIRGGYEFKANEWYVDATLSTPITETVGARFAAHYSDMDGYIRVVTPNAPGTSSPPPGVIPTDLHRFPKQEELFLRGTLLFEPSDRLNIRLKGTYTDTDMIGGSSFFSDITACPYGVAQRPFEDASNCQNDGVIFTSQLPPDFMALSPYLENPHGNRNNEQVLLTGTIEYDLTDALSLTSVTGYYDVRERLTSNGGYGPVSNNGFAVRFKNEQISQELRLASDFDSQLNFLLGGFFENRKLYTLTFIAVPGINFVLPLESTNQEQDTYSVFGQLLWNPTDQIEVTVGGRYTHEIKKLLDYTVEPFGGTPVDVTQLPAYPDTKRTFNNFSPEVTVTYKPHSDLMLFASFKKGFKSGGYDAGYTNGAILADPARGQTFGPEKVTGGEIGMKSRLADQQLTFNLTAYWYEYKGLQVSVFDTISRAFKLQNAAKARVRGIELETQFDPRSIPGLNLHAAASVNDAKYREYEGDCYAGQTVAQGCNLAFNPIADQANPPLGAALVDGLYGFYTAQDLSGRRLRKAPVFTANVGGYYEFPVISGLLMSFGADLNYSSKYNVGTQLQPIAVQPAFAKIDATLRVFSEDKRWELALIGRNLTNKRNLVNGIDRTGTGGVAGVSAATKGNNLPSCTDAGQAGCSALADLIGTPALPRTVALQATFRY